MAARFWVGGGSNTNWNAGPTTNWAATSGGAGNQSVPGSSDDVTFDGAGAGNGASVISATTTILSLTFTSGYTNTITLNTAVTITVAGNFTDHTNHTWVVNGSGTMVISAASTIASGGKTFPGPVSFTGANTKTLNGNWTISGALSTSSGALVFNKTTAEVMSCAGFSVGSAISGTINITITGGTWSGSSNNTLTGTISIAGNVTVTGTVTVGACTLTYTSGTVTTTGSTLQPIASTTLNTNGISWNNVTFGSSGVTITINSLLTVLGTLNTQTTTITFAGTSGFTAATYSNTAASVVTVTFANTVTYTITSAFNAFSSRVGSILLFTSDHASNRANINLSNAATTCNVLASFTRINASGRPIITFNGTITDCINVYNQTTVLFRPVESFNRGSRRLDLSNKNKSVMYS